MRDQDRGGVEDDTSTAPDMPSETQQIHIYYTDGVKRINDPNHAKFLTFSTFNRQSLFDAPPPRDAFAEQLRSTISRHDIALYAWVLMPNHVHLLIRESNSGDVEPFLRTLKTGFAKRMLASMRSMNSPKLDLLAGTNGQVRFWQRGGGYDRNIVSAEEFDEKVGYIHENPVRAKLVERSTDWAWGSARWWDGDRVGEVECVPRW